MNVQMICGRNLLLVNEGLYFEALFWLAEMNSAHVWMDMREKMKQSHACVSVSILLKTTCLFVSVFVYFYIRA